MGDYASGTTTSGGAAGGGTFIDSVLGNRPDAYYEDWWAKITSGTYVDQVRRISTFAQSTGTVTPFASFGGTIATSVTYELHRINPDDKDQAIKQVLRQLYPTLHKPYYNDTLVTGNWLRNGNFEDWTVTTIPDSWAKTGSLTCVEQTGTTLKRYGAKALKATAGAATQYAYQSQLEIPELLDLRGQEATFRAWVYTATASNCRLQIYDVNEAATATTTNSAYHTGNSRWQLLEVKRTLPDDLSTVEFRLTVDVNGAIGYFDLARAWGPTKNELYLPASGWKDISLVDIQYSGRGKTSTSGEDLDPCDDLGNSFSLIPSYDHRKIDDGTDKRIRFGQNYSKGYKVVLRGMTYLTQPASDSATTEVDEPQVNLVVASAIHWLYSAMPHGLPADEIGRAKEQGDFWRGVVKELKGEHGMRIAARIGIRAW